MATNPFLVIEPHTLNGRGCPQMNIVVSAKCYGGTFMLFSRFAAERGVEVRWVRDPLNMEEWARHIDANTRFVYGEMPSNPSLAVFDIAALATLAHTHTLPLIIDATLATPALLRPLCHDADIVVHSVSKSMAASGFAIAGVLIARHHLPSRVGPDELRANFASYVKLHPYREYGLALSPFNALMILNDVRTLRSRMDQVSRTALQVACFLSEHPMVEAVAYPGLPSHPGHDVAKRSLLLVDSTEEGGQPVNRYGYLLSFSVKGGAVVARRVFDHFKLIWRATDLGRIKSVATIPAISTHQRQGDAGRELANVAANQIRLSVGAEHPADIIADLEQALAAAQTARSSL